MNIIINYTKSVNFIRKGPDIINFFVEIYKNLIILNDLLVIKNSEKVCELLINELKNYNDTNFEITNILNNFYGTKKIFFSFKRNKKFVNELIFKLNLEIIETKLTDNGVNNFYYCNSSKSNDFDIFSSKKIILNNKGWVYVARCETMKNNIYKIGKTQIDVKKRMKQLSESTSTCGKFETIFYTFVENCTQFEDNLHKILEEYRVDKEFFYIPIEIIEKIGSNLLKEEETLNFDNSFKILENISDNRIYNNKIYLNSLENNLDKDYKSYSGIEFELFVKPLRIESQICMTTQPECCHSIPKIKSNIIKSNNSTKIINFKNKIKQLSNKIQKLEKEKEQLEKEQLEIFNQNDDIIFMAKIYKKYDFLLEYFINRTDYIHKKIGSEVSVKFFIQKFNFWQQNKFDPDIIKERVSKMGYKIIKILNADYFSDIEAK